MIKLEKSGVTNVIFTLLEKETTSTYPDYLLTLKNCQTNNQISNIPILDISTQTYRYDEFLIGIESLILTNIIYSVNTTLTNNKFYFVIGDITINSGVTLTIPTDTYVIYNGTLVNNGTITNISHIILDTSLLSTSTCWHYTGSPSITSGATYLFGLLPGYYEYVVYDSGGINILETGKLLLDKPVEVTSIYAGPTGDNTYVYNG